MNTHRSFSSQHFRPRTYHLSAYAVLEHVTQLLFQWVRVHISARISWEKWHTFALMHRLTPDRHQIPRMLRHFHVSMLESVDIQHAIRQVLGVRTKLKSPSEILSDIRGNFTYSLHKRMVDLSRMNVQNLRIVEKAVSGKSMQTFLKLIGIQVVPMPSDDSCQFWSLGYHLKDSQLEQKSECSIQRQVRTLLADWIGSNYDKVCDNLTITALETECEDAAEYLMRLRTGSGGVKSWGNEFTLVVATHVFRKTIQVIDMRGARYCRVYGLDEISDDTSEVDLHETAILIFDGDHYDAGCLLL